VAGQILDYGVGQVTIADIQKAEQTLAKIEHKLALVRACMAQRQAQADRDDHLPS
jgi:hypothetical protein